MVIKRILSLAALFLFLILAWAPTLAWAQPLIVEQQAVPTGPMSTILGDVIQLFAYALGLTLSTMLILFVRWLGAKFKVSVPAAWMEGANSVIDKGIHYAEEKAKQAVKNNADVIDSNAKLNTAAGFVLSMTDDKKLLKMGEEKLKQLIEARLNQNKTAVMGTVLSSSPATAEAAVTPVAEAPADVTPTGPFTKGS